MKQSMSYSEGKIAGQAHNFREKNLANVNDELSKENLYLIRENIEDVYHELFDESLEKYNTKQIEKGHPERQIEDYLKHINSGKQEASSNEAVVQLGNRDSFPAAIKENRDVAKQIFNRFLIKFQEKYPQLHVIEAAVHVDESTPHLHLRYIPVVENSKRGLETRVGLGAAMKQMGYDRVSFLNNDVYELLESVAREFDIERLAVGNTEKHLDLEDYKRRMAEPGHDYEYNNDPRLLQLLKEQSETIEELTEVSEYYQQKFTEISNDGAEVSLIGVRNFNQECKDAIEASKDMFPKYQKAMEHAGIVGKVQKFIEEMPDVWRNYVFNPVTETLSKAVERAQKTVEGISSKINPKTSEKASESVSEHIEAEYGLDSEAKDMTQAKSLQDISSGHSSREGR